MTLESFGETSALARSPPLLPPSTPVQSTVCFAFLQSFICRVPKLASGQICSFRFVSFNSALSTILLEFGGDLPTLFFYIFSSSIVHWHDTKDKVGNSMTPFKCSWYSPVPNTYFCVRSREAVSMFDSEMLPWCWCWSLCLMWPGGGDGDGPGGCRSVIDERPKGPIEKRKRN